MRYYIEALLIPNRVFVSIIQRIAAEVLVPIAVPILVSTENCVSKLIETLTQES